MAYRIGESFFALKKYSEALDAFKKIVPGSYIYPDSIDIVVGSQLACAGLLEKQDKWQEAEKFYEKVSAMDVDESSYARERLEWIRRNKN